MKAYKAFTVGEDGKLHSTSTRDTPYDVVYTPGEISRGHDDSKLFVSKEKDDALYWAQSFLFIVGGHNATADLPMVELWEVEVGDSLEVCHVVFDVMGIKGWAHSQDNLGEDLRDFWKVWVMNRQEVNTVSRSLRGYELWATPGAYVCDWVKPVKRLQKVSPEKKSPLDAGIGVYDR